MSDSQANLDVEDVLSSIRRLVTQDDPAARGPSLASGPGKLVLTKEHRVSPTFPSGADVADPPTAPSAAEALENTIVELEAAVSGIEANFEADLGDATDDSEAAVAFDEPFPIEDDSTDAAGAQEDDALDVAEDGEAPTASYESNATDATDLGEATAEEAELAGNGMAETQSDAAAEVYDAEEPSAEGADGDAGDTQQETPDEGAVDDAAAAEEGAISDEDERVVAEPVSQEPELAASPASAPIDPEMLYAMVAEIVRAELQGSLGERLTDRIRKLVRREIQIALDGSKDG